MSEMFEFPATLTRELPVRVLDISGSGCLLETRRRMEVGTTGTLQLRLGDVECRDDVEVVRCDAVKGIIPTRYHVGVRLLWTTPRRAGSIRHAVASQLSDLSRSEPHSFS
jgi:PilZ domain-containing protein